MTFCVMPDVPLAVMAPDPGMWLAFVTKDRLCDYIMSLGAVVALSTQAYPTPTGSRPE